MGRKAGEVRCRQLALTEPGGLRALVATLMALSRDTLI